MNDNYKDVEDAQEEDEHEQEDLEAKQLPLNQ